MSPITSVVNMTDNMVARSCCLPMAMFKTQREISILFNIVLEKKKMRVTLLGLLLSVGTYGGKLQVHFLQSLPLHCVESRYFIVVYTCTYP